ncbi:hypothetical protein [Microbacterium oleivorans]|uniref:Uncharacterized protein n=1 Tax=Microbacterium oleivorans TaxID=273677 RepID=A0A4R5YPA3_9MICO|nr:hypothetical protein [Microbacterium oleivorans]TDL45230.1 hypothetical protein E2R54_01805 [Microbacterium oleivorans]
MPNLSKRFLRGRPMTLHTTASLTQIRAELMKTAPNLQSVRRGWGSINEDPDILGELMMQPPTSAPELLPAMPGRRPQLLAARLYWFNALHTGARGGVTAAPQYRLDGTDILISHVSGSEYLLVVSTHTPGDIDNKVIPELKKAIMGVDANVIINSQSSSIGVGDGDFFLWAVKRRFAAETLGANIELDDFDYVKTHDPLSYQTDIARGVKPDRPELLTLLAKELMVFGPAKFSLNDTSIGFSCELTLEADGSFDIPPRAISYTGANFASIPEMRLTAVTDLIFTVLPAMKAAWLGDASWQRGTGRTQFRAEMKRAASALVATL